MVSGLLYIFVGAALGFLIGWLFSRSKAPSSTASELNLTLEKTKLEERISNLMNENQSALKHNETLLKEIENEKIYRARTEENNKLLTESIERNKKELELIQEKFKSEFENIANKLLEEKSKKFTEQNKSNIDILLSPLKEKLKDFEDKVDKTYKAEAAERNTLKGEIKNLIEATKSISSEASNLSNALKGDNKMQGNWGELFLEKVLEASGLKKDIEYKLQYSVTNDEGKRLQPDVVILLPDNKHIIIDSKVSMVAYSNLVNCKDEAEREKFLKEHLTSIRNHVKQLSDKEYFSLKEFQSPDFVLLFVPIESSFGIAIQADAELFSYAWERKIVIVSPSTLLATLRTIAAIWKQERQSANVMQIADEGGKLYDKLTSFIEDLIVVGKKMDDAKNSYGEAMKKLHEGKGNLVKRAEKMKELGAKTSKSIPQNLIDRANETD